MIDETLKSDLWGAWVAQSVRRPTSAQVMISRSVSSSLALGSVLTAQSLEPVSDSVSPSLLDPPPFMLCLSQLFESKLQPSCFFAPKYFTYTS